MTKAGDINAYSVGRNAAFKITRTPKLLCVRHQMVQRSLGLVMRLSCAIAKPHQPITRMAHVVAHFFERLGRNRSELCVAGVL